MGLPQSILAGVYEVSAPALRQLRNRHGITLEEMANPPAFLAALEMAGARKDRIFRKLADPVSRAQITDIIACLKP